MAEFYVENVVGMSVALGICCVMNAFITISYIFNRAWTFFLRIPELRGSSSNCCGDSNPNAQSTAVSKNNQSNQTSMPLLMTLNFLALFGFVRFVTAVMRLTRFAMTPNTKESGDGTPTGTVLSTELHIINAISTGLFLLGLAMYVTMFSLIVNQWLQAVRDLMDVDTTISKSVNKVLIHVTQGILIVGNIVAYLLTIPAIVIYSIPKSAFADPRIILWVVGYGCGSVFIVVILSISVSLVVLGTIILLKLYQSTRGVLRLHSYGSQSGSSTVANDASRVMVPKIRKRMGAMIRMAFVMFVVLLSVNVQMIGIITFSLDLPPFIFINLTSVFPEYLTVAMILLMFSKKFVNHCCGCLDVGIERWAREKKPVRSSSKKEEAIRKSMEELEPGMVIDPPASDAPEQELHDIVENMKEDETQEEPQRQEQRQEEQVNSQTLVTGQEHNDEEG